LAAASFVSTRGGAGEVEEQIEQMIWLAYLEQK